MPAAFGRLCVETRILQTISLVYCQPPSGGCVLKPQPLPMEKTTACQPPSGGCVLKLCFLLSLLPIQQNQPPSGGCVLKLVNFFDCRPLRSQPPSGGCVLKQRMAVKSSQNVGPAAFGRLCVETYYNLAFIISQ